MHDDSINLTSTTMLINEIIAYKGDLFEFAPRLGIGYRFGQLHPDDESAFGKAVSAHQFAVQAGLGFGWAVSQHVSLGFNLDYVLGVYCHDASYVSPQDNDEWFHAGGLSHGAYLTFNIGFGI